MRPAHSKVVLLAVLLANAGAVLFFRFFITVDGPVHVLHASLMKAPWPTGDHVAHGVNYNVDALPGWLGDRILMLLLLFCGPEQAHDIFAALASCVVVLSVVAFLRAHGTRIGPAILWLAPLTFNILLIMGLFHFMLAVALAFVSAAWWKAHATSPRIRWIGTLVFVVLAWSTHRSAPFLLCLFLLASLAGDLLQERANMVAHASRYPTRRLIAIGAVLVVGLSQLIRVVQLSSLPRIKGLPALYEMLLLRNMLLLDHDSERWLVGGIGVLLLISLLAAAWERWQARGKLFWHDTMLVVFLGFAMLSWLYHSPNANQLFIAERCQWLALLCVVVWLAAIADLRRSWAARVISGAALCALPLQVARLVQAESAFSSLRRAHLLTMEAGAALGQHTVVLPVMADPNWLLQHSAACVAIRHDGILLTPDAPLTSTDPRTRRIARNPDSLMRHWREGIPGDVDQILFMGSGIGRTVNEHPWSVLLQERYQLSFDNGYARIYSAVRKPSH